MIPSELDRKLTEAKAAGSLPFFVSTTSGTTVLGAFDPIEEIADVCENHGVWLHVDVSSDVKTRLY
jgi:glutamate/tyrosine decarboxylase-like PLP-dependent enzyme